MLDNPLRLVDPDGRQVDSRAGQQFEQRVQRMLRGEITPQRYSQENKAVAQGAVIGLSLLPVGYVASGVIGTLADVGTGNLGLGTLLNWLPGLGKADEAVDAGRSVATGVGEASSLTNAARLRGQLAGQEIAGGHAFEKHVLQEGAFEGLGIRTRDQFASHIENVINNPTATRQLSGGRTAYWDDVTNTVVIRNPRSADGGTAFQPVNGRAYFDALR